MRRVRPAHARVHRRPVPDLQAAPERVPRRAQRSLHGRLLADHALRGCQGGALGLAHVHVLGCRGDRDPDDHAAHAGPRRRSSSTRRATRATATSSARSSGASASRSWSPRCGPHRGPDRPDRRPRQRRSGQGAGLRALEPTLGLFLGLPDEDRPLWLAWVKRMHASVHDLEDARRATQEFWEYIECVVAERRQATPGRLHVIPAHGRDRRASGSTRPRSATSCT